jgi:ABC-type sugar transport system permease subunit
MDLNAPRPAVARARVAPVGISAWWSRHQRGLAPYLFLTPFVALFCAFFAYPVGYAFYLSLYRKVGFAPPSYVGLQNYADLIGDGRFLHSLGNTTYYAAGSLFILSPLALLIALALDSDLLRLKGIYRLLFFVPYVTSAVVVALMFVLVFDKTYGLLNSGLSLFGLPRVPWIESTAWSMPSIIMLGIWTYVGLNALYFLAGLQNVSRELIEAARIDGANALAVFWNITIPQLRPVILFVAVQAIIGSYNLFSQPFVLTSGGPDDSTLTMTLYLYIQGFQFFNFGYAAAIGYAIAIVIIIVSVIQLWVLGAFREEPG